ncbi:hypothetical protein FACS1894195_5310 [Bacteroidia bacterium]|nr:hypothetical protein FACS1894195_5310 [Bacteroidia bacterium]
MDFGFVLKINYLGVHLKYKQYDKENNNFNFVLREKALKQKLI